MEASMVDFRAILKSVIVALVITALAFFVLAVILYATTVNDAIMPKAVFAIAVVAVMTGGIVAAKSADKSGFLYGALVALGYFAVVFIFSVIANKGAVFNLAMLFRLVGYLIAGMLGGIIGINTKPKKSRYR